jgi:Spy/CpxP family protein refolding chaperone
MMKPVKALATLAVISGSLFASGSLNNAAAMGTGMGTTPPGFGNMTSPFKFNSQFMKLARYLKLTTEQKTQIKAIIIAEELIAQQIRQKIAADSSQIAAAAIVLPYDEATVAALANQLGTDAAALAISEAQAENQIFTLLTFEQQVLFAQIQDLFFSML